jgi:uncharacterized membrane protein YadS
MVVVIPMMAFIYSKNEKRLNETDSAKTNAKSKINFWNLVPKFVLGFLLVSIIRSIGDFGIGSTSFAFGFIDENLWGDIIKFIKDFANILFVMALGGVGLSTDFSKFKGLGIKPFLVGLSAALTIGIVSFFSVSLLGGLISF